MIKYLLYMCIIAFFYGCSFSKNFENNFIKAQKHDLNHTNFNYVVEKIISEMLQSNNIILFKNTLFFIDILENKTNVFLKQIELTELIKNKILIKTNKINFVKQDIIEENKKKLGISNLIYPKKIDTSILLSRNLKAKYYLYTCISGKNQPFLLKIKLILVKTGEIIFTKKEKFFW